MILLELFWSVLQVGLFSIGGGYAAIPLISAQAVTANGWLTQGEFTDLITIAEMTPGPIAVNSATFVGLRVAGLPGAVVATFGCITPALFIVSALAFIYYRYRKLSVLQSVLASLWPAVVALIASAGLTILRTAVFGEAEIAWASVNWIGLALFAAALVLLRWKKLNPILVMTLCGAANLVIRTLMEL